MNRVCVVHRHRSKMLVCGVVKLSMHGVDTLVPEASDQEHVEGQGGESEESPMAEDKLIEDVECSKDMMDEEANSIHVGQLHM